MSLFDGLEHVVRENEPLGRHTWLRIGGAVQCFAEPTSVDELELLVRRCRDQDLPVRLLGGGSNVLVRDQGVAGAVISLSAAEFCQIRVEKSRITAGGGAKLAHVISTAVREGLGGIELLAGVPGTVGGALHGNAGGQTTDAGQWARAATVMTRDGDILVRSANELRFAYRQSSLDELVIVDATFELEDENPDELTRRMQKQWIVQRAGQPTGEKGTCCMFRDPFGESASDLIDQAGLKGTRVGDARLFDADPNFIEVASGASSDDVLRLIDTVRLRVSTALDVELEPDLEVW